MDCFSDANIARCAGYANYLLMHLPKKYTEIRKGALGFSFKVKIGVHRVSVSVPPLVNHSPADAVVTYELVLYNPDTKSIFFSSDLGYMDTCRFYTKEKVYEELDRLQPLLLQYDHRDDDHDEDEDEDEDEYDCALIDYDYEDDSDDSDDTDDSDN
jgi:hypothetical protein